MTEKAGDIAMNNDNDNAAEVQQDDNAVDNAAEDPNIAAIEGDGFDASVAAMPEIINNKYKNIKMLDLFEKLSKNLESFRDAYGDIDSDSMTTRDYTQLLNNFEQLKSLEHSLEFYKTTAFSKMDYEKNLYTYLLMEKMFVLIIKNFRRIMRLDVKDTKDNSLSQN